MRDYVKEDWRAVLESNGLADFDALWQLEAGWFEEPNRRRGGWSGVSRCELTQPGTTGKRGVFLKRQENHKTFSWRHPVAGIPTFWREFQHIMHYRDCGVPTLEPVYFAARRDGNGHRAILITEELSGFVSLEALVADWTHNGAPPPAVRRNVIRAVAHLARRMHRSRIQHNCFYPKHIFVRVGDDGQAAARVIDLEKSRSRPFATVCALRDLDTLNRHAAAWRRSDRLRFLLDYLGVARLPRYGRWLWRQLAVRAGKKRRNPAA